MQTKLSKNNKIPADKTSVGAFDILYDQSQRCKALLKKHPVIFRRPRRAKIGDYALS
jgi:predicted metalloendopeptidase